MRKTSSPLSDADMTEVAAARSAARERFKHFADEEMTEIEPARTADPDNPTMSDEQLARLRPAAEIVPGLVVASLRRKGGRPRAEAPKVAVSIRLDPDIVEALRAGGSGWQSRANEMLRKGLGLVAR